MNVSADGFESLDQMATTSCNPRNCSACATLVKFKATPITEPQECPASTLSVSVLDLAKNDTPANIAIDLFYHTGGLPLVIADGVDSLEDHVINQNGIYEVSLSAPGYKPTQEWLVFNCTPENCHNCSQVHTLNMEQIFCDETHFEVTFISHFQYSAIPYTGGCHRIWEASE